MVVEAVLTGRLFVSRMCDGVPVSVGDLWAVKGIGNIQLYTSVHRVRAEP